MTRITAMFNATVTLAIIAAALLVPGPSPAQTPPGPLTDVNIEQRLGESVPLDLPFRDEEGRTVRLGDLFDGRPVILSLVYYECPMLCTLVLNGLTDSLTVLPFTPGEEFRLITISIDPGEDALLAAAKKAMHVEAYGRPQAAAGWSFLTGDEESIRALADAVGFHYVFDPDSGEYAHASGIMILTPDGRLARYMYGVEYPPRDLRFALMEASAQRIGTIADQILLFCYQYDPATGKYGAATFFLIRLGGIITIIALSVFFIIMFRRERQATPRPAA